MSFKVVFAEKTGTAADFEDYLIKKAQQEQRTGIGKVWIKMVELYELQKHRLITDPYPEAFNDAASDDESPPVVKEVTRHTQLKQLYRWGLKVGTIGNHRSLYTVHNYYKVVILHHFDKRYHGDIKQKDIVPAEAAYFKFLDKEPSYYPVMKG